jgi:hypothetical protein
MSIVNDIMCSIDSLLDGDFDTSSKYSIIFPLILLGIVITMIVIKGV